MNKGVWVDAEGCESVAVKTVKSNGEIERLKLLQEAAIMGQFAHVNVVRLHGVVTVGNPVRNQLRVGLKQPVSIHALL